MMGACYLTEWTDDLAAFYEVGEEVETYRDAVELVEKVVRLRAEPARRRRLRERGQAKALAQLTVASSLARIISALGLNEARTRTVVTRA